MAESGPRDLLRLGFLRVLPLDGGFVGGLLVTSQAGRPLEFQCSTPVRPNRTQQLLYGLTLEAHVAVEVIGKTLLDRTNVAPHVLLVSQPLLLELREHSQIPVLQLACVEPPAAALEGVISHAAFPDDLAIVSKLKSVVPATADLHEPLERVREALGETLRSAA